MATALAEVVAHILDWADDWNSLFLEKGDRAAYITTNYLLRSGDKKYPVTLQFMASRPWRLIVFGRVLAGLCVGQVWEIQVECMRPRDQVAWFFLGGLEWP